MFIDRPVTENDIYAKLLSDKLPSNLGYLYENLMAQMIVASGRELYYHTWKKNDIEKANQEAADRICKFIFNKHE